MGGASAARADDAWKEALKAQMLDGVTMTKSGMDRLRITEPGTVFVIQAEGVSGNLASDVTVLPVTYEGGRVKQAKGFIASISDKKTNRDFKKGERVYLIKLEIKDDHLRYWFLSCDTFDVTKKGSTEQTRYKAVVDFKFDDGFLPTAAPDVVKQAVAGVALDETAAAAASTKTIELGQTVEQVEGILGKPQRIVKLGEKVTYFYADMKVIFVDGKVADVQ